MELIISLVISWRCPRFLRVFFFGFHFVDKDFANSVPHICTLHGCPVNKRLPYGYVTICALTTVSRVIVWSGSTE